MHHRTLPESFSLAVFSDGILEILSGKDVLEKEQALLASLSATDGSLEDIVARLQLADIKNAPDDIALLTLHKRLNAAALAPEASR